MDRLSICLESGALWNVDFVYLDFALMKKKNKEKVENKVFFGLDSGGSLC